MNRRFHDAVSGVCVLAVIGGLAFILAQCTACTRADRQAVADAAQVAAAIACAIENAELNDPAIEEACHITDALFDRIRPALATHRRTVREVAEGKRGLKPAACP